MAVKLRLTRVGSKKNPIYRVVAADDDGRALRHLRENRLERGEVAVDVVQGGDRRHVSRRSRAGAACLPPPRLRE